MSTPDGPIRPQPKSSVNPESPGKSIAGMVQNLREVEESVHEIHRKAEAEVASAALAIRQKAEAAVHEKRGEAKAYGTKLVAMGHDAIMNFLGEQVREILPHLMWERKINPIIESGKVRQDVMVFTLDILNEHGALRSDVQFSRDAMEHLFLAVEKQADLQNFVVPDISLFAADCPVRTDAHKTKLLFCFEVPYDYIGKVHLNREPESRNNMKTVADVSEVDAAGKSFRKEMKAVLDEAEAPSVRETEVVSMRPARKKSPFPRTVTGGMKAAPAVPPEDFVPYEDATSQEGLADSDDEPEPVTLDGSEIGSRK